MSMRITIVCPESEIADANQLALCLGNGPADVHTFNAAIWENEAGQKFALASLLAGPEFHERSAKTLVQPENVDEVDLIAAGRAQAKLNIWMPYGSGPIPQPTADALLVIIGLDPGLALPLLRLSPIPFEVNDELI